MHTTFIVYGIHSSKCDKFQVMKYESNRKRWYLSPSFYCKLICILIGLLALLYSSYLIYLTFDGYFNKAVSIIPGILAICILVFITLNRISNTVTLFKNDIVLIYIDSAFSIIWLILVINYAAFYGFGKQDSISSYVIGYYLEFPNNPESIKFLERIGGYNIEKMKKYADARSIQASKILLYIVIPYIFVQAILLFIQIHENKSKTEYNSQLLVPTVL